jgi:glucose-6-phosphate 1-dehydrogenase
MTPLTLVIFGASGDLTSRKLAPALYNLFRKGRLPTETRLVGVARSPLGDDAFRHRLADAGRELLKQDGHADRWDEFARRVFYVPGDGSQPGGLDRLRDWFQTNEPAGDRLFYLAVSPELYEPITARLGETGLGREEGGWRRLVVEKPFGHDLASCQALNHNLTTHFREDQLYRIDHYLGKETVQNILVFRFANVLFEPVWNSNYIDHVQISVAETVTVGRRGGYYDQSGVLRDMFQNHLLQLLTLVAMEPPARFAADPLRNEKVKVLDAIPIPNEDEACQQLFCGQYEGYRAEPGVDPQSRTPTFAAVRLQIDNWRWRNVPFYLRSGKGMAERSTEVIIQFRCPPHLMFPLPPGATLQCNRLSLCIQPDEGIHLSFQSKVPNEDGVQLSPADLEFHFRDAYPDTPIPEAYERLLLDAIQGDAALFMRSDEIERAWEIMDPLIAASQRPDMPAPASYRVGSTGPAGADAFIGTEGRSWLSLCRH